ncbi:hypothetical protein [Cryobacterium lyxosi]|uniref:Uncharacterized protein n=1 Tax=Cryobacterium lyxosi TaxID=1259228 RepID=A0A4R8ZIL6_9MICO|nr:hypothetical protein [Cryobacterium lyxosi]TFD26637.1 hypothetical protein E3T27_07650 [Cryobacterium lyxosi]
MSAIQVAPPVLVGLDFAEMDGSTNANTAYLSNVATVLAKRMFVDPSRAIETVRNSQRDLLENRDIGVDVDSAAYGCALYLCIEHADYAPKFIAAVLPAIPLEHARKQAAQILRAHGIL